VFHTYKIFQKREREESNWDSEESYAPLHCEVEKVVKNNTWAGAG